MSASNSGKRWTKTSIQNLVRHQSGRYYARLFSAGKERWRSLKTDVLEVAKNKLRDLAKEVAGEPIKTSRGARMMMSNAITVLQAEIEAGQGLRANRRRLTRETAREYRRTTLEALKKSWRTIMGEEFADLEVRKIGKEQVEKWAAKYRAKISSTRFNGTLSTLRRLFDIAIAAGEIYRNPASTVGRAETRAKKLTLPDRDTFQKFVASIREAGHRTSRASADFVQFLAFTGARKQEACDLRWQDVDFQRGRIHIADGKGGYARDIPMIPEARELLERLKAGEAEFVSEARVLKVTEARGSMTLAAKSLGMTRITHHDLRHLFATVVIESGIDIPTLSRWLGHHDGGVLALQTYGHLRDDHSQSAAKRVCFAPASQS